MILKILENGKINDLEDRHILRCRKIQAVQFQRLAQMLTGQWTQHLLVGKSTKRNKTLKRICRSALSR